MPDFSVNMHQIQFLAWPPPPAHMFPDLLVDLGERGGEREEEGRGREWGTEMESEGGEERGLAEGEICCMELRGTDTPLFSDFIIISVCVLTWSHWVILSNVNVNVKHNY